MWSNSTVVYSTEQRRVIVAFFGTPLFVLCKYLKVPDELPGVPVS